MPINVGNRFIGLLLVVFLAAATADAIAQGRGGPPGGGGMPGGGSRGGGMGPAPGGEQRPAVQEDPVSLAEYRLELLREDLRLTPEQQPAWKVFADKVIALAADISRERGRLRVTLKLNALQRIDQTMDVARNRLTALEEIAAAAKALYGRLTPEQQSLADARLATTLPTSTGPGFAGAADSRDSRDRPRPPQ